MIFYKSQEISFENIDTIATSLRASQRNVLSKSSLSIVEELSRCFQNAKSSLENYFSAEDMQVLQSLFDFKNLSHKLNSDLGSVYALDTLERSEKGNFRTKSVPYGIVLNISASNVLLGVIDNIINNLLTKNACFIKISEGNKEITSIINSLFKDSFLLDLFALIKFKGGTQSIEDRLVDLADLIVLWGADDVIYQYNSRYPHKKIISHGPRISFSVISKENVIDYIGLIKDFTRWNQKACSNTQVLFVEGPRDCIGEIMQELHQKLESLNISHQADKNEQVEILKELEFARYQSFQSGIDIFYKENSHLLYLDHNKSFNTTALNHTLKLIHIESLSELTSILNEFRPYLQSVSTNLIADKREKLINTLSLMGVTRFTDLGHITSSENGMPHEGEYPLKELTKVIMDQSVKEINRTHIGYQYASGGTTGEPKIKNYSYGEFNHIAFKLAQNYMQYLNKENTLVANMFMAGGLWSSFNVIQKAIEYTSCKQLPLGAQLDKESLRYFFDRLRPNTIFSIPSVLYELAGYLKNQGINYQIENIFFAGEKLLDHHESLFNEVFGKPNIVSAGYASVDIGLIGFQTKAHKRDEFILFDHIEYAIENQELLVRPFDRDDFIHTGDRVIQIDHGFKLLGRVDSQINIWGARLSLSLMQECFGEIQVTLKVIDHQEVLVINSKDDITQEQLNLFYLKSHDLNQTITSYDEFIKKVLIKNEKFATSKRTGKVLKFLDLRG